MRAAILSAVNQIFDLLTNKTGKMIMAKLEDVISALDEQRTYIASIDQAVEALHETIKSLQATVQEFTDQGITEAAADAILAKVTAIKEAADKIVSDN